jgi:hypothetical protein
MGTKYGKRYTSQASPDTITSLEVNGDTSSISGLHVPSSNIY